MAAETVMAVATVMAAAAVTVAATVTAGAAVAAAAKTATAYLPCCQNINKIITSSSVEQNGFNPPLTSS